MCFLFSPEKALFFDFQFAQNKFDDAIAEAMKAREYSDGNSETVSLIGYIQAVAGERTEALKTLAALKSSANERYVPPYNIAVIYSGLNESDKALDEPERAFNERDSRMMPLKIDLKLNNLRNEPRFIELMRRMNFE